MPLALLALMISAFGIGTTEFVITGLLPQVAGDLSVSVPTAGLLISGYALGVVIGGPVVTAAGTRVPRKAMLLILMLLFIAGNVLAAVAPSYWVLMLGRIFAAVCHGAFFGIASVVAADLVAPERKARAISLVFTGLTVANVVGAPFGTFIGQSLGWRSTFWMITGIGLFSLLGIVGLVPKQPRPEDASLKRELAVFARPQVWLALGTAAMSIGALFASFSYVAPLLTEVTGFASNMLTPLLVLFGVGLVAGNLLGGRYADRAQLPTLYVCLSLLLVVLVAFTFTSGYKIPAALTLVFLGGAGFSTVPGFMTRVIDKAEGAPTLASAAGASGANLGISLGAYFGGLTIDAGFGYTSPTWVGAAMAALGLGFTALSGVLEMRNKHRIDEETAFPTANPSLSTEGTNR
ncbi:MFS transporter, DHA1 family, arabinose polymer transporter [Actinopolyspora alba]|uniref:MFS transporter, DHA1 family, arabinose polymer transporter n=1 Tax=Actinopolyspora alba TaxID=673379 RepID=A0A1I1VM44_9ACTN|nr:MFS transporter [Actinopolyspora alba]SFD84087.1 MFS transporter, DHA1 family, arabinose polymer transporter [Actinopolyspora alba]